VVNVEINTQFGKMTVELNDEMAPVTVKNFLSYVDDSFYDNTIFHRVIDGFMVQGGGFTSDMQEKPTKKCIKNEANNGLNNDFGTLAMARTNVVDSATSQFFINVADNSYLNFQDTSPEGYGYAVFGKVIDGSAALEKIKSQPTSTVGYHADVPETPILIESIRRV
jgi:peptidyl-prolyl cis-trans isomerase B (cyclophilin B)